MYVEYAAAGTYRAGSCINTDSCTCETCASLTSDLGHYRTGVCRGEFNNLECPACDNPVCLKNQYRTGGCGLTAFDG